MQSPSGVARVCPGGELAITCSIDGSFIEWTIIPSFPIPGLPYRTLVVSTSSPNPEHRVLNMISFDFSHTTHRNGSSVSLVSFLSVTDVPDILNGTRVNCTDPSSMEVSMLTSATTVHVIRTDFGRFHCIGLSSEYHVTYPQ